MIQLNDVGAFPLATSGGLQIRFGVYLPAVRALDGFDVVVRVIHQEDRFNPLIQPVDFPLTWQPASEFDLWSGTLTLTPVPGTHFGSEGVYLYRFQLGWTPAGGIRQRITLWFTDPFARQTDIGRLSAVTVSAKPVPFAWTDAAYKTPELDDLIVYELQIEQFNDSFDGVIQRLTYLQSLGVNCLELMPVNSPKVDFDWGYGPLYYYSPSAHFGGPDGLRKLVDACHAVGMAVILDVVYQHVDSEFTYNLVYNDINATPGAPRISSPMIGSNGPFGPQVDFSQPFAQQFFGNANAFWLDEYHVDGFRYDEVTDLYVSPTDTGYAKLAYDTYQKSLTLPRFERDPASYSRIIQCAEALWRSADVMRNTYTNCAWTNDLLWPAEDIAGGSAPTADFAHKLDPFFNGNYPGTKTVNNAAGKPVDMPVAPFQFVNSHDHSHLIVFAGVDGGGLIPPGDRSLFWRMQPLAIAIYTAQGIPMLWEGEEFADNYNLPGDGSARINLRRDTHWEYFYDDYGSALIRVYRRLAQLRRNQPALRSRHSFYYWQQSLQGTGLIAYHRYAPATATSAEQYALIILNFGSFPGTISIPFPKAGNWTEMLDADVRPAPWIVSVAHTDDPQTVSVPSNYGCIFLLN